MVVVGRVLGIGGLRCISIGLRVLGSDKLVDLMGN
jgi:hypothetical protein